MSIIFSTNSEQKNNKSAQNIYIVEKLLLSLTIQFENCKDYYTEKKTTLK